MILSLGYWHSQVWRHARFLNRPATWENEVLYIQIIFAIGMYQFASTEVRSQPDCKNCSQSHTLQTRLPFWLWWSSGERHKMTKRHRIGLNLETANGSNLVNKKAVSILQTFVAHSHKCFNGCWRYTARRGGKLKFSPSGNLSLSCPQWGLPRNEKRSISN